MQLPRAKTALKGFGLVIAELPETINTIKN